MAKAKEKKAPTKSWVWDYFEQGKHYLTDQYHFEARCKACIRDEVKGHEESDQAAWEDDQSREGTMDTSVQKKLVQRAARNSVHP